MKSRILLKEKTVHGTALLPVAIHHLSYGPGLDTFFYLHWHAEFEFVSVQKGGILYTVEGREIPLKEGEGLFVQSNQLHAARALNGLPCEACVLLFHPNLFGSRGEGSAYFKFVYPILSGERSFDSNLTGEAVWEQQALRCMNELDELRGANFAELELLIRSRIYELWHLCWQNSMSAAQKGYKSYKLERMQPVLDYIAQNYREEITLKELADLLPMSVGQFCRTFKEVTNQTPIAYLIRYRVLQSCALLNETDRKIADIARNVGFNNISYFNREFIRAIGCSPGRYRAEGQG